MARASLSWTRTSWLILDHCENADFGAIGEPLQSESYWYEW